MKHVVSRDNPFFKALKKLCQSGRERRRVGRIVLDGMHLIQSHAESGGQPEEVVVSDAGKQKPEIASYLATLPTERSVTWLADSLFNELTQVETSSGILAIALRPQVHFSLGHDQDTILLDGIQDPGNVGSILRSAAAAGVRQVLLSEDCAQVWSPKVLRAGMGAHFQLDLHEGANLIAFLDDYTGTAVSTTLDPAADSLYALDLRSPVGWVFGSEGQGVRPEVMASVKGKARIPMPGMSESLNVAAAAAICLFEAVRQRLPLSY